MDHDESTFAYKRHVIICVPQVRAGGGYSVTVSITRLSDQDTVIADAPAGVPIISLEAAVEYTRSWACDWIDANR